jgi:hypothetical protein
MCNATMHQSFLNMQTMQQGRAPWTEKGTLHKMLKMYRELRYRDRIVTLNLLAAELKILDRFVQGLSLAATWRRIWHHTKNHVFFRRRVTHAAQNTRYEQSIIQG